MTIETGFLYGTNISSDALADSAFTVASESATFGKGNIKDIYLGKPYQFAVASAGGGLFRVASGDNDTINFNDPIDGAATVTLNHGNYTGTSLAVEVAARMTAAGSTGVYTCTYSTTTGKFTIARTVAVAFGITWTTSKAATLLGYTSNDTGGVSYEGDLVRVHSEYYMQIDLGSAQAPDALFFVGTNLSSSAVVRIYSAASSILSPISSGNTYREQLDGGGTLQKALTVNTDFGVEDFNDTGFVNFTLSTSARYWYVYISDPSPRSSRLNHEFGRLGIGTLIKPARAWAQKYNVNLSDPSPLSPTFGGMLTGQSFPQVRALIVSWLSIESPDKDKIELLYRDRPEPLVIAGDLTKGAQALYSQITSGPQLQVRTAEPSRWTVGPVTFTQIPRREVS